ncbi:MAG: helix-turn-helix transcriptional regulator [Deltaproteobacteria bacterium]|nr:helix-turn-helix transcriptional regulator [Deltaproteobacteria bacterium]
MDNTVGKEIKKARIDADLTQKDLAKRINLSSNYISQIEKDKKLPSLKTLFKIAKALKVKPGKLVKEDSLFTELSNLAKEHDLLRVIEGLDKLANTR